MDYDIEQILREIDEKSKTVPRGPEFDHAVLEASFSETMSVLNAIRFPSNTLFNDVTGREDWFWLSKRKVYLTRMESKTVLWPHAIDTDILKKLSRQLAMKVSQVNVYSPMRFWAYLEFENGKLTHQVLDPEEPWRTNVLSGDDLIGCGPRTYDSAKVFLKAIADRFIPVDKVWHFGAWENPEIRRRRFKSPKTQIRWALEVVFGKGEPHIAPMGAVPADIRQNHCASA